MADALEWALWDLPKVKINEIVTTSIDLELEKESFISRFSHASFFLFFFYVGFIFVDHLRVRVILRAVKEKEMTFLAFMVPITMHITLTLCLQRELLLDYAYDWLYFSCYGFTFGEFVHLVVGSDLIKVVGYVDVGDMSSITTTLWLESAETTIGDVRAKIAQAIGVHPAHRVLIKTGSGTESGGDAGGEASHNHYYSDEDEDEDVDEDGDEDEEHEFVTSLINQKPLSLLLAQEAIHHTPGTFFGSSSVALFLVVKYNRVDNVGVRARRGRGGSRRNESISMQSALFGDSPSVYSHSRFSVETTVSPSLREATRPHHHPGGNDNPHQHLLRQIQGQQQHEQHEQHEHQVMIGSVERGNDGSHRHAWVSDSDDNDDDDYNDDNDDNNGASSDGGESSSVDSLDWGDTWRTTLQDAPRSHLQRERERQQQRFDQWYQREFAAAAAVAAAPRSPVMTGLLMQAVVDVERRLSLGHSHDHWDHDGSSSNNNNSGGGGGGDDDDGNARRERLLSRLRNDDGSSTMVSPSPERHQHLHQQQWRGTNNTAAGAATEPSPQQQRDRDGLRDRQQSRRRSEQQQQRHHQHQQQQQQQQQQHQSPPEAPDSTKEGKNTTNKQSHQEQQQYQDAERRKGGFRSSLGWWVAFAVLLLMVVVYPLLAMHGDMSPYNNSGGGDGGGNNNNGNNNKHVASRRGAKAAQQRLQPNKHSVHNTTATATVAASLYGVGPSPVIGHRNASTVLRARYHHVHTDFVSALEDPSGWEVLRAASGVTIEVKSDEKEGEGWQYVKAISTVPVSAATLHSLFRWDEYEATQRTIDPFMEDAVELSRFYSNDDNSEDADPADTREEDRHVAGVLFRKQMRGPPFLPKREFFTVLREERQREAVYIPITARQYNARMGGEGGVLEIPARTRVHALLDVTLPRAQQPTANNYNGWKVRHKHIDNNDDSKKQNNHQVAVPSLHGRGPLGLVKRVLGGMREGLALAHHHAWEQEAELWPTLPTTATDATGKEQQHEHEHEHDGDDDDHHHQQQQREENMHYRQRQQRLHDEVMDQALVNRALTRRTASSASAGAVTGFQDFLSWYVDNGDGTTTSVVCMRVDLGPDVPRWLFSATVGFISLYSMRTLAKYARQREGDMLQQQQQSVKERGMHLEL
jgi:hypothetical protein